MSDQRAHDLTIRQQIDAAAYTRPDAPFLLSPEGIILSFQDLQASGRALEARLRELGVEPDVEADPYTTEGLADTIVRHTGTEPENG